MDVEQGIEKAILSLLTNAHSEIGDLKTFITINSIVIRIEAGCQELGNLF